MKKQTKKILLILIFVITTNITFAQFDTSYVHITKHKFTTGPFIELYKSKYRLLNIIYDNDYSYKLIQKTFRSKTNLYSGIGISFYRIGFAISFLLPYSNIYELKRTKAVSIVGGYSAKKFYWEYRYRNYNGFEKEVITYSEDSITDDYTESYTVTKDMRVRQIGTVLYYFSSGKFNFDANFKNYNIQKKSTFSPMLVSGINYLNIDGKFELNDSLGVNITNRNIDVLSFKLGAGVTGTVVYKRFYLSSLGNIGASLNNNKVTESNVPETHIKLYPSLELRTSLGYNSKKMYIALNINYDNDVIYFKPNKFGINNFYIGFKCGYKFNSKILGKLADYV